MAISSMKRMQRTFIFVSGILLAVFMMAGCVAQQQKAAAPAEQKQPETTLLNQGTDESHRQLEQVFLETAAREVKVTIQGNEKLTYTSIKQDFPFGIAIYLPETKIADGFKKQQAMRSENISDVVVGYADQEQSTVKVEILLKADLSYDVIEQESAIIVALNDEPGDPQQNEAAAVVTPAPSVKPSAAMSVAGEPIRPPVIPDSIATMTNIEFNTMESGKSDIIIQTNQPVKYDIAQKGYDTIYLNLYNTVIPDYHQRPLLTQYFKSAVESLMPNQMPGKKKDSRIEIKIRQAVPYRVVQNQSRISLFFEPSTVEPPVFGKARKKVESGTRVVEMMPPKAVEQASLPAGIEKKEAGDELDSFLAPKEFTGEKIKLDFFDTDIKNVFRILKSVSGKNFAIDKDVTGKVTLSLQDPVPWDQVMDLILKMNNLGQKQEGNVIRISTLEKLKKEELYILQYYNFFHY